MMVAVFSQKAGVFLYDNIENAYYIKSCGMLGWLFFTDKLFDFLQDKVEICLLEKLGEPKNYIQSNLGKVKISFKECEIMEVSE
jgi:hypothetical protein